MNRRSGIDVLGTAWCEKALHGFNVKRSEHDNQSVCTFELSRFFSNCSYMVRKYASGVVNCGPVDTMMGTGSPGNHLILF